MRAAHLALLALPLLAGCDDQSMTRQASYRTDAPAPEGLFPNGAVALPPPDGTVAQSDRWRDAQIATPPAVDAALLQRGHERYDIFCSACHGYDGAGHGTVVQRGFPPPQPLGAPHLLAASGRHLFDVTSNGYGVMYGFAARIPPNDRWAIVAYMRALQSTTTTLASAPDVAGRLNDAGAMR